MRDPLRAVTILLNGLLSPRRFQQIWGNPELCEQVYHAVAKQDLSLLRGYVRNADKHKQRLSLAWLEREIESAREKQVRIITIHDSAYPGLLKHIAQPPPVLYTKGRMRWQNLIALVGTRKYTAYGKRVLARLVPELVRHGLGSVSGMAYGIDYWAHRYTLDNQGYTLAVLGTGIDVVYPKANQHLYTRIAAEGGGVLSEFPLGASPGRYTFVQRNRIISGLAQLVCVIESDAKGGALITAEFALEQGKDVMAVPGSIFSDKSRGCNMLIQQGAQALTDFRDILLTLPGDHLKEQKMMTGNSCPSLNEQEKRILQCIGHKATPLDAVLQQLDMPIGQVYEILFDLEKRGVIDREPGNRIIKLV